MRKLLALALVGGLLASGLLASGCSSKGPAVVGPTHASPVPTGPQTYTVSVDGASPGFPLVADNYFPNTLKVHPGDAVVFKEAFSGEPHTVTLGSLVDRSLIGAPAPSPGPSPPPGLSPSPVARVSPSPSPSPALGGLPSLFPASVNGQPAKGDALPAAAQPCFLETGTPPASGGCPAAQPSLDGTQVFYNSGWLAEGSSFRVPISSAINPGTYRFRCLVHPAMKGQIQVVAPGEPVPGPDEVRSTGTAQLAQVQQALAPAAKNAANVTTTLVAGITQVGVTGTFVATFGPPEVSISAGQALSWVLYGQHAIAVNAPASAHGILTRASDGTVHINTPATTRIGGQAAPTGDVTRPVTVSGGSYSVSGFHNSGLLTSFPPGLITYTLQFNAPGTYTVECLIHPAMSQTVRVS